MQDRTGTHDHVRRESRTLEVVRNLIRARHMIEQIDEVDIYSKLESALFGSLVHAVNVSALIVQADISAIRLFEGPERALSTYANANRLGLDWAAVQALQQWPATEGSIFELAHGKRLCDHVFRASDLTQQFGDPRDRFFGHLKPFATVSDAFCVTFPVIEPAWCMIAYVRCAPNPPFDEYQTQMLERFKPALARVTRGGYQRELNGTAVANERPQALPGDRGAKATHLLAKLSRTERLILSFLRSEATERQIAQTIHRSPHTIHVHVKNIYRKLSVNSRRMLLALFDNAN